jgi:hypothetical protein
LSDFFVTSIPLVNKLTSILAWILLVNTFLIGAVVLLAYRAAALRRQVEKLEEELSDARTNGQAPASVEPSLEDDRPIPISRHRFGDASAVLKEPPLH